MTEEIRAILDLSAMPVDFWLYRLQEVLGFGHEASRKAEQLRPLVKHFETQGIKMPAMMPTPDLDVEGHCSIRVQLGRLKLPVSVAFESGRLSPDDRSKAKQLHRLANEIRSILGQNDRPEGYYGGEPRD